MVPDLRATLAGNSFPWGRRGRGALSIMSGVEELGHVPGRTEEQGLESFGI